jgi:homoserine dehydrogenase
MSALIQAVPQVSAEPALRAVRVGLAGCGVVGSAFAELLRAQRQHIAARHGLRIDIAALLVRDTLRTREPIGEHVPVTADPARFLAAECDVVIECIGGIELPYRIAAGALLRGVPLVTANKALIAAHGVELHAAARAAGTRIGIEAAVAGGAPVIRTVTEALAHTGIVSMQGVLNGTTNFMLSQLAASVWALLRRTRPVTFPGETPRTSWQSWPGSRSVYRPRR